MFTPATLRRLSALVLVTFTSLTLHPLQAVAQNKLSTRTQSAAPSRTESAAHLLDTLKETARRAKDKADKRQSTREAVKELRRQKARLSALEQDVQDSFAATEAHLRARNLPPEILARHQSAVRAYQARQAEFTHAFRTLERDDDRDDETARAQSVTNLTAWLEQHQPGKPHAKTDPHKLPFRTPDARVRPPAESPRDLRAQLGQTPVRLAGPLPSGTTLPTAITDPKAPPTADDLAATEDAQLTPAIQAKAAELLNNPVKIHNWVRNSIEFIPSYGSVQGSDMTLQAKRGNAFDIASLEIALLRAAGIPARYVYGTIQLPIAQAKNWVGGVSSPEAALNLLGQGGIPSIGLVSGGKVAAVNLEHIWVEAYVDYVPSRGALNKTPDTWVPLDASIKQYTYTQGMDIKSKVPLDANALLTQAQQGATVNTAEGWVQNLNQTNIQSALTNYQSQVQNYVNAQNTTATVGDVLGTKTIVQSNPALLAGVLPYKTVATGSRFAQLPDNLRWKYRTALHFNATSYASGGGGMASLSQNTVSLAGKKITLSFIPATQADTDLISSYLPKPHADGSPIQPSELPTSLPGYLLNLKAEIRVDGQLVSQSTSTFTMGQDLMQATAFYNPSSGQWEEGEANHPIAGEYHAMALDLQGTNPSQLAALKTKLEQTKAKIAQYQANPADATPVAGLTKEDLSGDLLYAGILGYFASVDGSDALATKSGGQIVNYRAPSYGTFMANATPHYFFGIVTSVSFPGVVMDVDRLVYQTVAKDDDNAKRIAYLRQAGAAGSAFEHAIPERLFADPSKPLNDPSQPQGVSAMKALAIAASQGQKIYTLNANNQAYHAQTIVQLQIDVDTKQEITNALAAGKEVTVHQAEISVNGWTGCGYIILDPDTGAGAYKISGGANGGALIFLAMLSVLGIFYTLAGVTLIGVYTILLMSATVLMDDNLAFDARVFASVRYVGQFLILAAGVPGAGLAFLGAWVGMMVSFFLASIKGIAD